MIRLFLVGQGFDVVFILVVIFSCHWALTSSFSSQAQKTSCLAKTKETFKLSDLQYLEARLDARHGGYECKRLVLDASSGSSLFRLSGATLHDLLLEKDLPSSLCRCEWVASILAQGKTAEELLVNIREDDIKSWEMNATWTVDYLYMNDQHVSRMKTPAYTAKCLLHCVAQAIQAPATLSPDAATDRLKIIDIDTGMFLVRVIREADPNRPLMTKWKQRPFPYSSAINQNVAEILIDLVFDLARHKYETTNDAISFLDPTCGSGTFLAFALARGASVQGWDTNESCVNGALRNLKFVFGNDCATGGEVCLRDASHKKMHGEKKYDCMIANLPWGQNTLLYYNENVHILDSLSSSLRPGAPCAIISKDAELQKDMHRLGYHIIGSAHIPPLNFVLPTGKKGNVQKRNEDASQKERSSNCVITISFAPQ